jgi:CRP/FNR family transcriptional regulator
MLRVMPKSFFQPFADNLLYDGLNKRERARLSSLAKVKVIDAQGYLFHQHTPANSLYIIHEGELVVERSSSNGLRQILAFVYPGNFVGFTHNDFFEYSVHSLTDARLSEFPRSDFLALCEDIPRLKKNIDTITSNVMLRLFDQLFALGKKKSHERVCFLLQQLLEREEGVSQAFDLVMTRQDMADYLGLTLETVSRAFSRLQKDGIIHILTAHKIEVLNCDALKELAFAN